MDLQYRRRRAARSTFFQSRLSEVAGQKAAPQEFGKPVLMQSQQAYLTFMDIDFVTKASNNHASLTGALPFLLPAASSSASATDITTPVPSNRIQRWVREEAAKKSAGNKASKHQSGPHMDDDETMVPTEARATASDPPDMRYEAYMSLLDHRIRNAYVPPHPYTPDHHLLTSFFLTALHPLPLPAKFWLHRFSPLRRPQHHQPPRPPHAFPPAPHSCRSRASQAIAHHRRKSYLP